MTTGVSGPFGEAFRSEPLSTDPAIVGSASTSTHEGAARGSSAVFNASAMTAEVWFKPARNGDPGSSTGGSYIFDKMYTYTGTSANFAGMALRFNSATVLRAYVGNGTANLIATSDALTWSSDTWYHLAVTYSAATGTLNIFRDGSLVATNTNELFGDLANAGYYSARSWSLANRTGSTYGSVPGDYDNFRVSSVAYEFGVIPEPGTLLLAGAGLLALGVLRRRR